MRAQDQGALNHPWQRSSPRQIWRLWLDTCQSVLYRIAMGASLSAVINDPEVTPAARLAAATELAAITVKPELRAVCEVDLHIHSFYSDGYHSPTGRVYEAYCLGMQAIALTDHDNFDGIDEALAAAQIFDLELVPGIEFYTDRPGIEIIAYWPIAEQFRAWRTAAAGNDIIDALRQAKHTQLAAMLARVPECMARHGLRAEITADDIRRFVRNGISTKGDISVVMWQKYSRELLSAGIAGDVKDFQARYTTQDSQLNVPLQIDLELSPASFVSRVRDWGGLPGISHPTELRTKEGMDNAALAQIIDELGALGLQCLEVDGWRNGICPETGKPQTDVFLQLMHAYNQRHRDRYVLLPTNGSDDHNQPGEGLQLGCGRGNNLRADCGRYAVVAALRRRAAELGAPNSAG